MNILRFAAFLTIAVTCLDLSLAAAETPAASYPGDRMTLGDARSLKAVFSVTGADAAAVTANLAGIRDMGVALRKQGVTPDFVVVFMGPSVKQLVRGQLSTGIGALLAELRSQQVGLDVCSVAIGMEGVAGGQLVDGVRVVGDGLIAVLAYQQRGYGYAPPF